jgi:hypothetical protein
MAKADRAASIGQQKPPVRLADAPSTSLFEADRTVESLGKTYCPQGLEHFLPGSYYYCVGVRDLAKGNYARSRRMLRIAAGWGNKSAQFLLGIGYFKGDTGQRDRPLGLAWMGLAAERRDPNYSAIFTSAWQQATPQERARAQALWQSMLPTYEDAHAARRAEMRFEHARDALVARSSAGQQVCIAGLNVSRISTVVPEYTATNNLSACGGADLPVELVAKKLDVYAEQLFDGWAGHVSVGALKAVGVPSR